MGVFVHGRVRTWACLCHINGELLINRTIYLINYTHELNEASISGRILQTRTTKALSVSCCVCTLDIHVREFTHNNSNATLILVYD